MTGLGISSIAVQRLHTSHRWYGFRSWFIVAGRGSIYFCMTAVKAASYVSRFCNWQNIQRPRHERGVFLQRGMLQAVTSYQWPSTQRWRWLYFKSYWLHSWQQTLHQSRSWSRMTFWPLLNILKNDLGWSIGRYISDTSNHRRFACSALVALEETDPPPRFTAPGCL